MVKTYDARFKAQVVLETLNPNTTIESVRERYGIAKNTMIIWRKKFLENAHLAFKENKKETPSESPEELKRIIGELTVQNEILKKVSSLMN
ncbi:MAG TPA: hypothetical protein ENN92_00295 [candidate division WWE3 bacterium]|uniref:Transposase n=1 Tax=candidate division WWE3 bacterium TaxID=2053526 RepID=A0A7C1HV68_UNCKA|nr:hypothetical protein [candidate division WWE3 bacterium]